MTIGLSLPLGYLTGAEDTAGTKCLSNAFGGPRDCLAELKDNGITSIELQGFGPDMTPTHKPTSTCALQKHSRYTLVTCERPRSTYRQ